MKTINYKTDLCIIGGGLSGICAAISAARHNVKVILVQDRPMLGGNSSSEIRMWVGGAKGKDNRESGLIEEIECENYYYNTSYIFPMWDTFLYQKVLAEPNITLLLNTTCFKCDYKNNHINSIICWQLNTETTHIIEANIFADCSGDSIIAGLTGAACMYGREVKKILMNLYHLMSPIKRLWVCLVCFKLRKQIHRNLLLNLRLLTHIKAKKNCLLKIIEN